MTEPSSTPQDNDSGNTPDSARDSVPEKQGRSAWGRPDGPRPRPGEDATRAYPQPDQATQDPQSGQPYGQSPYSEQQYGQPYTQPGPYGQVPPQAPTCPGAPGYGVRPAYGAAPGYPAGPGYPGYQGYPGYGVPLYSPKSKVAAALLAFFLGGLGVHNFYLGLKKRAIGQLATTIISVILLIAGFFVMFAGFGDSYNSYDGYSGYYNTWDEENTALIGLGATMIMVSAIALCVVSVWAFVEFILILVGSGNYAHDREGLPLN